MSGHLVDKVAGEESEWAGQKGTGPSVRERGAVLRSSHYSFIHVSAWGEQLPKESVKQALQVQGPGVWAQRHPKGRTWKEVVLRLMPHRQMNTLIFEFFNPWDLCFPKQNTYDSCQRLLPCRLLADRSLESTFHWGIPPIAHIYHGTSHTAQRKGRRGTDCRTGNVHSPGHSAGSWWSAKTSDGKSFQRGVLLAY